MNILGIRTDSAQTILMFFDGTQTFKDIWQSDRQLAEGIHSHISELLKQADKKISDIEGIVFFEGPGSFTGLRIGVSVANALASANNLPIVAYGGDDWFERGMSELQNGKDQKQVVPFYGAEPNVTAPKK